MDIIIALDELESMLDVRLPKAFHEIYGSGTYTVFEG